VSSNSTEETPNKTIAPQKNRRHENGIRRRNELKHFLRSRRASLSPGDLGMTVNGRRNTSGLRREEVAVRAGVSASWYTWLEQGRNIKVSDEVVGAVSDALNLNGIDRSHLFLLAGLNPPPDILGVNSEDIARLIQLVDQWLPMPAYAVDRYWNNLFSNESARSIFGPLGNDYNHFTAFFTDQASRACYLHWADVAVRFVGQFRVQSARFRDDPHFDRMVAHLSAVSPEFADIWARHGTCDSTTDYVKLRSPSGCVKKFERITLGLFERYDIRLVLHIPGELFKIRFKEIEARCGVERDLEGCERPSVVREE
jgi:transcriptional regulator with XRE-family HTH domain